MGAGAGVMVQDKPAPRKAPLIILLFGNGGSVLTGYRAVHLSELEGGRAGGRVRRVSRRRRKSKKYKVSGERLPPPPHPLFRVMGPRFSKVVHLSVRRLGWLA